MDLYEAFEKGQSLLHIAASKGHDKVVQVCAHRAARVSPWPVCSSSDLSFDAATRRCWLLAQIPVRLTTRTERPTSGQKQRMSATSFAAFAPHGQRRVISNRRAFRRR